MSRECWWLRLGDVVCLFTPYGLFYFWKLCLDKKRARYTSVSVHPWNDLCHGADSSLESCSAQLGGAEVHGSTPEQQQ